MIRPWRCARSKLGGHRLDAATTTKNDMLLPANMAAWKGTSCQNQSFKEARGALL
jgi:hypothetical protein